MLLGYKLAYSRNSRLWIIVLCNVDSCGVFFPVKLYHKTLSCFQRLWHLEQCLWGQTSCNLSHQSFRTLFGSWVFINGHLSNIAFVCPAFYFNGRICLKKCHLNITFIDKLLYESISSSIESLFVSNSVVSLGYFPWRHSETFHSNITIQAICQRWVRDCSQHQTWLHWDICMLVNSCLSKYTPPGIGFVQRR